MAQVEGGGPAGGMPVGWTPASLGVRQGAAFRHARRRFLRGDRIDMGVLAGELGVSRVTLYRWFGRREELLVRILWSLTLITLAGRTAEVAGQGMGRRRVPEVLSWFVTDILDTPGLLVFLANEGDLALRLLTIGGWGYQPSLVEHVVGMLDDDVADGVRSADEPLRDLAFVAVRVVESYVHLRRITGEQPDGVRARRVLHVLLR